MNERKNIPDSIDAWELYDNMNWVEFYHDGHLNMFEIKEWLRSIIGDDEYINYRRGPSGPFAWCFAFSDEAYVMMKIVLSETQPIAPPRTFYERW